MRPTLLSAVVLVVVIAGCTGGSLPGMGGDTPTPEPAAGGGGATGSDDCRTGGSYRWVDPGTGEQVSLDVQGTVTHEGRQVCKAVYETTGSDADYSRVVMYYATDDSYQKVVYYDAQGNVVNEIEAENPAAAGTADGGGTAQGGTADDWCVEGQTASFADPRSGQQASMEVKGLVDHEGREVCKAVYETDDPDTGYSRVVMFYTEDDSYRKIVYYDEQGNVINEFTMAGTPTATGG